MLELQPDIQPPPRQSQYEGTCVSLRDGGPHFAAKRSRRQPRSVYGLMSLTVVDASIPPPLLNVLQVDVGLIEISWPVDAMDYTLECATILLAGVWSPVTNGVVIRGDQCTVQLEVTESQQMYRLRK